MLPIFFLLICTIIEFGSIIIPYAAVDDAAYAVSHAYGVDPSKSDADLKSVAAAGPLDAGGITITKSEPGASSSHQYTHHFPNTGKTEQHWLYSKDVVFTVTYSLQPQTIIGRWIANENGIEI